MIASEVDQFLSSFSPAVRELALLARALVLEVFPTALEIVDPSSKIIAYGVGRKYSELVCAVAPYNAHVNIIFSRGVELPDPNGLLEGTGKRARHVKLRAAEDVAKPAVRELIVLAVSL